MAEQQYRVIKDRNKGDDPKVHDAEPGDLLIHRSTRADALGVLVRIERPVPTTDEPTTFEGVTPRGFGITEFDFRSYEDAPVEVFSVQESSLAFERKVWIGVNRDRAHLNEDEARRVRDALNAFLGEQASPFVPTREQIAEAMGSSARRPLHPTRARRRNAPSRRVRSGLSICNRPDPEGNRPMMCPGCGDNCPEMQGRCDTCYANEIKLPPYELDEGMWR